MGPFLVFFLGCFLMRTHLHWYLFSIKEACAYPAHKNCVVWDSISAPGVLCAPGHLVEQEKLALLLFGILATTHPCGLWVEDFAGPPSCLLLNMEEAFVTNCGWLHHFQYVSVCQFILQKNTIGYLSVIIVSVRFFLPTVFMKQGKGRFLKQLK